jgi:hypothetical protein
MTIYTYSKFIWPVPSIEEGVPEALLSRFSELNDLADHYTEMKKLDDSVLQGILKGKNGIHSKFARMILSRREDEHAASTTVANGAKTMRGPADTLEGLGSQKQEPVVGETAELKDERT